MDTLSSTAETSPVSPDAPEVPVLPEPPTRITSIYERVRMAVSGMIDPLKQKQIDDMLEEFRRTAYEQGRQAERLAAALGSQGASEPAVAAPKGPAEGPTPPPPHPIAGAYVSRTTFSQTRELTLEYLQQIGKNRATGPTEVIKNVRKMKGVPLTYTTVRRALEALVDEGLVVEVESSRWRLAG